MKLTKVLKITYVLVLAVLIIWIISCKYNETSPSGGLVNYGDCKKKQSNSKNVDSVDRDSSTECIEYTYNAETGTLLIKHVNAAFNCCPGKISTNISIENSSIIIDENEEKAGCLCNCLIDLELRVIDLEPGNYHFVINNPYAKGNPEPKFECDLNLTSSVTDSFCVSRNSYPWGL